MATPIDHTEHLTSPHMVMGKSCGVLLQCGFPVFFSNITFYGFAGGLPDSAALCATDLTSEVCGSEVQALFSSTLTFKKLLQYLSHRMFAVRAWNIKCRRKEKLIAQFGGKLRDERFEPN